MVDKMSIQYIIINKIHLDVEPNELKFLEIRLRQIISTYQRGARSVTVRAVQYHLKHRDYILLKGYYRYHFGTGVGFTTILLISKDKGDSVLVDIGLTIY